MSVQRFNYKAVDYQGGSQEGVMDALDSREVAHRLQQSALVPVWIRPARGSTDSKSFSLTWRRGPGRRVLVSFISELATLLSAGVSLDKSLKTLQGIFGSDEMAAVVARLRERVREGDSLAVAMATCPKVFPDLYIGMVRAGEAAGNLDVVLADLAAYQERQQGLRDNAVSALIYPSLLLVVTGVSIFALLTFVVPRFAEMFADMGMALPWSTQLVITVGDWLRVVAPWLVIFAGSTGLVMGQLMRRYAIRLAWDKRCLSLPLIGPLLAQYEMARFAQTLAFMLSNGIHFLEGLKRAGSVIGNRYLREVVGDARTSVEQGGRLSAALSSARLVPLQIVQMIAVGEESGRLSEMLQRVAQQLESRLDLRLKRVIGLLEPVLIISLGVTIALIMVAILSAVLSMNELVA